MTSIIESFLKMNLIGQIGAIVGFVASVSGIILWALSNIFNGGVIPITFVGLGLPAILGFIASLYGISWLVYVVLIYSLPLSLYMAGTPSIFRFFVLVSLGYLISAVLLTMGKRNNNHQPLL